MPHKRNRSSQSVVKNLFCLFSLCTFSYTDTYILLEQIDFWPLWSTSVREWLEKQGRSYTLSTWEWLHLASSPVLTVRNGGHIERYLLKVMNSLPVRGINITLVQHFCLIVLSAHSFRSQSFWADLLITAMYWGLKWALLVICSFWHNSLIPDCKIWSYSWICCNYIKSSFLLHVLFTELYWGHP